MIKKYLILVSLLMVSLTACGTFSISADVIGAGEATATAVSQAPTLPAQESATAPSATAPPTPEPTPEEVPTEDTAESLLPAPLYYLNPADGQVWRVEVDGETLTQVSHEAAPVEQYDVNPVDGSLALLSDNALIVTDALGGDRRVIVDAPSEEEAGVHWYLTDRLSDPVWSADGRQLAYGLNGINFYDVADGSSRVVLPNDEMTADGEEVRRPIHVYTPEAFSPDGASLLLTVGFYQSGGGSPAVLRLNTAAPLVELQGAGFPCCTFRWSRDSATIFSANDTFGMFQPGLWRSDAASGETEVIMPSETGGDDVRVFNWPHDLGSGEIAVFTGEGPRADYEQGRPRPMTIATVDVASGTITGRQDGEWIPGEAAWLADGEGVALTESGNQVPDGSTWPLPGVLHYVPLKGGPAVELPASGHRLDWGAANE